MPKLKSLRDGVDEAIRKWVKAMAEVASLDYSIYCVLEETRNKIRKSMSALQSTDLLLQNATCKERSHEM